MGTAVGASAPDGARVEQFAERRPVGEVDHQGHGAGFVDVSVHDVHDDPIDSVYVAPKGARP
jgi:hypothetical protein